MTRIEQGTAPDLVYTEPVITIQRELWNVIELNRTLVQKLKKASQIALTLDPDGNDNIDQIIHDYNQLQKTTANIIAHYFQDETEEEPQQ